MNSLNKFVVMLFCLIFFGFYTVKSVAAVEPPTELYVRTVPDGAKVFLNGSEVGVTPGLFPAEPGTVKVEVKLDGYDPIEKEVEIHASRITRLELEFKEPSASENNSQKDDVRYVTLEALPLNPDSPEANNKVGLTLKKNGEFQEAEKYFQKALQLKPNFPEAHNNLGFVLAKSGRIMEAIEHYEQSLRLNPNCAETHSNLGKALLDIGRVPVAIAHYQQALRLDPELTDAHYNLALALAKVGRAAEATAIAKKALELARSQGQTAQAQQIDNWLNSSRNEQANSQNTRAGVKSSKNSSSSQIIRAGSKGQNILKNPGAETGNDTPDDWQQGAALEGVAYSWDKNVGLKSQASLCIEKTAQTYFPIAQWSQTLDHQGNKSALQVSAQVKAEKMTKAIVDVIFLDENDNWISHKWAAYIGAKKAGDPPANHDWKNYSGKVNIPPNTRKICIGLQVYGPGKVWFDDIQASYGN